jgi:hypothetical protein
MEKFPVKSLSVFHLKFASQALLSRPLQAWRWFKRRAGIFVEALERHTIATLG